MTVPAGTRFGRYEIRSLIRKGGMGEVYLAQDTQLRRPVAIKILTSDFTHDTDRLHRFEHESYAASSLNHPNILTIHEIGSQEGLHSSRLSTLMESRCAIDCITRRCICEKHWKLPSRLHLR
jgi:serine/threonine protein kinase